MTFTITAPSPHPRGYYEIDGTRYPRVTSILSTLSRPGIGRWREKLIREGRDPDAEAKEAADRGTAIHALTEAIDLGGGADCPPDLLPFIAAYRKWKAEHVARVEATERLVVHRLHGYAGKLDRIYVLRDGRRVIGDLKTGRSVSAEVRLQLAAYNEALAAEGDDGIDGRIVIHLPWSNPGVARMVKLDADERDRRVWRSVLRLYKWQHAHRDLWRLTRDGGKA